MALSRRALLGLAGATSILGGGVLLSRALAPRPAAPPGLRLDPSGLLHLAPGFSCELLDRTGQRMSDGLRVPGRPDGMACFPRADGALVLMRNHELLPDDPRGPYEQGEPPPPEAFDPGSRGGVTRLVLDEAALHRPEGSPVRSSNLVLHGTNFNCGGGDAPSGWLSCEENVEPGHGFVFLCPIDAERVAPPRRLPALGRFRHEAALVERATGIIYLTEDQPDACFYRFVPRRPEEPFEGELQALVVVGAPRVAACDALAEGQPREVTWVPVDDPTPAADEVRARARDRGAASFRRLEGAAFDRGTVVFTATTGGRAELGQVFRLRPTTSGGTLELIYTCEDPRALQLPDNVAASRWGDVYLAEDGDAPNGVRCLTRRGELRTLAVGALSGGEISGVCFSPDGRVLFANLQADGVTLAIVGPFETFGA